MRLSQVFRQKECVFSIEVFPPKKNGATPESLMRYCPNKSK